MTNREAIDRLSIMQGRCENGYDEEALDLAIKALEFIDDSLPKTFDDYLKGEEE